ncbi:MULTISPECIES: hypothetical protein [Paraburkholderia]|nr:MULTISPECIES: hypothetical protein [Paraburkholderia]MCX4176655.1 hypothetical protein [Paraburkholderia madseniana]MDQ6464646.1 hypothetical protein [Paraburkholderia madseniana]
MTAYALREILLFAAIGFLAAVLQGGDYWLWMGIAGGAYLALALLSSRAFNAAVKTGFVSRSAKSRTAFGVHPECKSLWLVRRHILATPSTRLAVPASKRNN